MLGVDPGFAHGHKLAVVSAGTASVTAHATVKPPLPPRGSGSSGGGAGGSRVHDGAAWGEAVVGRPVFVRPRTWTYSPGDYVNAERLAAERHEATVVGSKPVSDNITGEKRKEPEPEDAEEVENVEKVMSLFLSSYGKFD